MKVIKTFGQEKEDIADFQTKIDHAIIKNRKVNFLDALFDPFITIIIGISYVLTIIVGGNYVMDGTISIGQLVSFISYIGMLVWPMFASDVCLMCWNEAMLVMIGLPNCWRPRPISLKQKIRSMPQPVNGERSNQ